ncbi:MAG: hypothetical protein JXN60_03305, partial [Lentisphaerae bacterium]|nr:hypothetical protein [Lentisphaerota bacterium]
DERPCAADEVNKAEVFLRFSGKKPVCYDVMGNRLDTFMEGENVRLQAKTEPIYLTDVSAGELIYALENGCATGSNEQIFNVQVYATSKNGRTGLLTMVYNNSVVNRNILFTFSKLPEGLILEEREWKITIPANKTLEVFAPFAKKSRSIIRRGNLTWRTTETGIGEVIGEAEVSFLFAPFRKGIKIDGNLSEWTGISKAEINSADQIVYGPESWNGPSDMSGTMQASWDEQYLYLAMDVTDDIFLAPQRATWNGDCAELFFNLDFMENPSKTGRNEYDCQFSIAAKTSESKKFDIAPDAWPGMQGAGSITEKGYAIELQIPMQHVRMKPEPGSAIRVDFVVDDGDEKPNKRKLQGAWAGIRNNWKTPVYYGSLILTRD